MTQDFNLLNKLGHLKKWAKKIALLSIVAGIATGAYSLLLPNYYEATTSFYAANPLLSNPTPLGSNERSLIAFGTANDIDRFFALGLSRGLQEHLISKFDLSAHYKIDTVDAKAKYRLLEKFANHYRIMKNKYDAVEVSFESTLPQLSADVANEARNYIGMKTSQMMKSSNSNQLTALESAVAQQETLAKVYSDSILKIKNQFDIVKSMSQGDFLAEQLVETRGDLEESRAKAAFYQNKTAYRDSLIKYQANTSGYANKLSTLNKNNRDYNSAYNILLKLEVEYGQLTNQNALDKERIKQYQALDQNEVSSIHVVDYAEVPLVKIRPHRAMLVLSAMVITAFLAAFLVLIFESEFFIILRKAG